MYFQLEYFSIDSLFDWDNEFYDTIISEFPHNPYSLIREENGKIFIRKSELEQERLYYDFDLSIGDTILTYNSIYPDTTIVVQSIDTLRSGELIRKQFNTNINEFKLIEGIGNSFYLNHEFVGYSNASMVCFSKDGETILIDSTRNCNIAQLTYVSEIEEQKYSVEVYPNPFNQAATIRITPKLEGDFTFRLYSSIGEIVKSVKLMDNEFEYYLERKNLTNGIYFYELIALDERLFSGKIIISN